MLYYILNEVKRMKDKYNLTKEQNLSFIKNNLILIIYNSARLEGINTTYPDTKTILEGVNVPSLKLDEINCILNLRDAWNYVLTNIDSKINLEFICKVNSYVSRNESLEWGVLRNGKVGINGVDYIPDIPIKEENINEFNKLLTEYYNTNNKNKIVDFLYENCIFGLEID